MLGFTPLASAPLADSGVKNYEVIASDITAGVPVLDTATVAVISNFAPQDITAGVPVLDTAPVFEDESFAPQDIFAGDPVLDTLSIAVTSNFAPQDLYAGTPVLDPIPFFQDYQLALDTIFAGQPTLSARFTWDFQELVVEDWLEASPQPFPLVANPVSPNDFNIRLAILLASVGYQPEEDLFANTIVGGRSLGAVRTASEGYVFAADALEIQRYAIGSALTQQASIDYIENFMLPYMAANPDLYSAYYTGNATSSRIPNWDEQEESSSTWSEQVSFPESNNNYGWTIVEAITLAATNFEPETTLFVDAEATQGRPLGDINNSGVVTYLDALDMASYIRGALSDQNKIDYIINYMLPYMAARPDDYKIYYNATAESRPPSWTAASESVKVWTNAA
jgi:hypothetical protein